MHMELQGNKRDHEFLDKSKMRPLGYRVSL